MVDLELESLRALFQGKRVLITGHTGFKGSWLTYLMHLLGAEVRGLALPMENPRIPFHLLHLPDLMDSRFGDIRDQGAVQEAFAGFKPEFLFHLAAQPLVRYSYQAPKETFDVNVGGSVNILEAVRATPSLRSVIYVTSDKCYKNREWIWGYRENDEMGGHDPYSASKAVAELVFSSYCDSFFNKTDGLGVASVRAGNVIGGGDWALDRIVPDCIRALEADRPIVVRNPRATRPWQHVLEPICGYVLLAARLWEQPKEFSGAWNFGPRPESVRTVAELSQVLVDKWGHGQVIVETPPDNPHEANLLMLNCDKSYQELGWRPRWNFSETLEETVHWYRQVQDSESAAHVMREQITKYLGWKNK